MLTAALLRPVNLLAPGAGLLLALSQAPWWTFPLSLLPYGAMVYLSLRDPKFVEGTLRPAAKGAVIAWEEVFRELGHPRLVEVLERIRESERGLAAEAQAAPEGLRPVLDQCLTQLRSAARVGIELARRVQALDKSLAGLDAAQSRREAAKRRQWAHGAGGEKARAEFLEAAERLEEAAASADSLAALRERTFAQLDNVAASLESVAVRSVRVRVEGGAGADDGALQDALRVDVETLRETLALFEGDEDTRGPGAPAEKRGRR